MKKKEKWFDWHFYPKPLEVRSIIEIIVFLLIIFFCGFLYYRWNVVPLRRYEINIENLGTNKVYSAKDSSLIDSLKLAIACDVKCVIPMTTHQEFVKDDETFSTIFRAIYSNQKYSKLIRATFIQDSLRLDPFTKVSSVDDSVIIAIMKEAGVYNLYGYTRGYRTFKGTKTYLDSLKDESNEYLKISQDSSIVVYSKSVGTLPFFSGFNFSSENRDSSPRSGESRSKFASNNNSFINETFMTINSAKVFSRDSLLEPEKGFGSQYRANSKDGHWYSMNIIRPFRGGLPMESPSWLRLEDISQAYVDFKINTCTIDSIVLCLDFVGVTEFSNMEPSPDFIGMSKIVFCDPIKIFQIRANGLKFHAKFSELENIQEIRVFTVTAIMSAFTLVFVLFVISAFIKLRNKFKRKLEQESVLVKTILYYGNLILWGLLFYHLIYWTIMYSMGDLSILECNLIAIPIVIFILILIFKNLRTLILRLFAKIGARNVVMLFSLLIFLSLISVTSYKIVSMNYDDIIKAGDYRRATRLMYDSIMSKDTIDDVDYNNVRKALIGEGSCLLDNQLEKYERFGSDHNTFVLRKKDTLVLYNTSSNTFKKYTFPNLDRIYFDDKYILIYNPNLNLVEKNTLNLIPTQIPGYLLKITDGSSRVISRKKDTLYYTSIFPKVGIREKLIFCKGWLNNISIINDYMVRVECDPTKGLVTFFYKFKDNKLKEVLIDNKKYILGSWHSFDRENNVFYDFTDRDYVKFLQLFNGKADYISLKKVSGLTEVFRNHWDMNKLKLLKSILSRDDKLSLLGVDSSSLYLYNSEKNMVETYHDEIHPSQLVQVVKEPEFKVSLGGACFVCIDGDVAYVYNNEKLLYKKQLNFKFASNKSNNIAYPIANPLNSKFILNITKDGFNFVYDKWLINTYQGKNRIRYLENDSSLIYRNKYLSNTQKGKLLNKLKRFHQTNAYKMK